VIVMVREDTLNSSRSPALMPAYRRMLGGTTRSSASSLTVVVMAEFNFVFIVDALGSFVKQSLNAGFLLLPASA